MCVMPYQRLASGVQRSRSDLSGVEGSIGHNIQNAMDAATARALVGDGDGGELDYTAGLSALKAHLAAQPRSPQETALIHWYERSLLRDEGASPCVSRARHRT